MMKESFPSASQFLAFATAMSQISYNNPDLKTGSRSSSSGEFLRVSGTIGYEQSEEQKLQQLGEKKKNNNKKNLFRMEKFVYFTISTAPCLGYCTELEALG